VRDRQRLAESGQSYVPTLGGLPPLRSVVAAYGLDARKSLGQHFLFDLNLCARIVRAAALPSETTVVEVGPGPGGLTRSLIGAGHRVVAVERDSRCLMALGDLAAAAGPSLTLVHGDALNLDLATLAPAPRAVVANLPYNIASPLLIGWLRRLSDFHSLTLMFQQEVAERLVARPGTEAYGRLSVITQWLAEPVILFNVPARAFTPPPKVTSTVVRLTPRAVPQGLPAQFADMEAVTAAAFGQRRKMLRSSLKSLGACVAEQLLAGSGIDPTMRAESLDVTAFAVLAHGVGNRADGAGGA